MIPAKALVDLLLSQAGDRYIFGAEASQSDSNPDAFDCSELIEWGCARLRVFPRVPDGSWYQARHCRGIPIAEAIQTPGALLFRFSSSPFVGGRPRSAHVAVSQGNGLTIEARSSVHGVGQFSTANRGWTHAGAIPGINYKTSEVRPMPWTKPGDHVETMADVAAVHAYQGHRVMKQADIDHDENDPRHLDERNKITEARILSLLMELDQRKVNR